MCPDSREARGTAAPAARAPRSVLHVIDTWGPGGAETVFSDLAAGLDPRRYRSLAAVIREGWVHDTMLKLGIETTIVPVSRRAFDVGFLGGLRALAKRCRADLIQSHLLTANLYCSVVGRSLGIPVVSTFHGTVDLPRLGVAGHIKLRTILYGSHRTVFVSDALRRHFLQHVPAALARTRVIHNGVDTGEYDRRPAAALRRDLGLHGGDLLVGAVGNVRSAKAYDVLVRVADRLRNHEPKLHFVVAGRTATPLFEPLQAMIREAQLEDRIRFTGFTADVAAFLNGVDIYLSTSSSEGFSLSTVQAMACGIPVVVTRSGGPEEIVTDELDGLLVPVGEPDLIAAAVSRVALDAGLRRRLTEAGRRTAVERFSTARMIDSYSTVYDEVLGS